MFNDFLKNKKTLNWLAYLLSFFATLIVLVLLLRTPSAATFFDAIENRTFDIRQSILSASGAKKASKDIIIVTIDDASYEYILNTYGEWPLPRDVYADLINYLENYNPRSIAFDLMFVNSIKSKPEADLALIKAVSANKNVFVSMNFDDQPIAVRKPIELPENLEINVQNNSKSVDLSQDLMFTNCRAILSGLLNGTQNVGIVNVSRADDGVLRKMPPIIGYQNRFYPQLSMLVGLDYLNKTQDLKVDSFVIDKNSNLILGDRKIPLDTDGGAVLNWYGKAGKTFTYVPIYKLIDAMKSGNAYADVDFKDKIIYFGTTAVSLFDTKTVPIDRVYPGVEIHATYLNNIIDNNFIAKVPSWMNIAVSVVLALLIGFMVIQSTSTLMMVGTMIFECLAYCALAYYLMTLNVWIAVLLPILAIILNFILAFVIKYLIKSRDFDYQYKLATTDGLTELYNHRYFQDEMKMQIDHALRYKNKFSLIIVDIDFFKKFNDKFGHQSGDAVLKQVAAILKRNVRATDVVCRYGGEEMSIILPNSDKDEVRTTAQKLCALVAEKPFKLTGNQESNVTISLGVSTFPDDGKTPQELIEVADKGLYVAKENGRNQVGN